MKLKTQKEMKEEIQDEKQSNPIHEYLDVAFQARQQFVALEKIFTPWKNRIVLPVYEYNFEKLFQTYGYKNKGALIKYTHDPNEAIEIICHTMDQLVECYNEVYPKISPFDQFLLKDSLPFAYEITEAKQIYLDFQNDPERAKERWCKCESH